MKGDMLNEKYDKNLYIGYHLSNLNVEGSLLNKVLKLWYSFPKKISKSEENIYH